MKKEALKNGPNEPLKIHKQNENDIIIDINNNYPHDTEVEEINNKTEINSNPFSNSYNKESQDIIENSQDPEKNESLVLSQDNQNMQKEESQISNYKDSNDIFENKQDFQKDISMRNYNDSNDKSENIQNIQKDSSMSFYKDTNDEFENKQNLQEDISMDNNKDSHFNFENLAKDHIINKKNIKNLAGSVVILKNKIPQDTLECNLIMKKSQSTVLKNKHFDETLEKNENTQNQVSGNICSKAYDNNIEYNERNMENKVIIVHSDSNINIEENIRSKFMLKVYGILLFQYIFTFGIILLCQAPRIKLFLIENDGLGIFLMIISLIIFITAFILFLCKPEITRKVPLNYLVLFVITICETILLCYISIFYNFQYVLGAICFIIAICFSIFFTSLISKINLGFLEMSIISLTFIAITYGLLALFTRNYYLIYFYCLIIAVIYAFYLIYDTQLIRDKFNIDDYIFAALTLYFDTVRLFISILRILGRSSSNH